jgi:hypothetical protein
MPTSPLPPQQRQQQQKPSPTTLPPNAPSLASLNITEDPYHLHSWPEVLLLIQHNRLDAFHRIPEELERYLIYCAGIRKRYGSMMDFIVRERLKWGGEEEERRGDEGEKTAEEVEGFEGFGDECKFCNFLSFSSSFRFYGCGFSSSSLVSSFVDLFFLLFFRR